MEGDRLDARVSVNEVNIADLQREADRTRKRLDELEADRQKLRLLNSQFKRVTRQLPELARRAATEALDLANKDHEDQQDRTWSRFEKRAMFALGIAIAAINLSGFHFG